VRLLSVWDRLSRPERLLAVEIGRPRFDLKEAVYLGLDLGRELPVGRSDVLLQIAAVTHAHSATESADLGIPPAQETPCRDGAMS
jgi:uncharacterized protein YjlB